MKYEYNGHLLEEDRINLVANEIITKYPQISFEKAKEIAMLEGRISITPNLDIKFNRLYNAIFVLQDDKIQAKNIYKDIVTLLNENEYNQNISYYCNITLEIANYLLNKRDFPLMNEF
ncbi:MAG: hypothetical protein ACI4OT_05975 [Bacilli bacterium]